MIVTRNASREVTGTAHTGLTVATYDRYTYDEQYVRWAVVWDPTAEAFARVSYDGGYADQWTNVATVDAPAELLTRYAEALAAEADADTARAAYFAAEGALRRVEKGTPLRVVRGRKVPKGTTGRCIWTGEGTWGARVGLVDAAGTAHFTAAGNVEVDVDGDTAADLADLNAAFLAATAKAESYWVKPAAPLAAAA